MPPRNYLTTRKGVKKHLRGGLYEKSDKDDDPNDFQLYKKWREGETLDVRKE
jgi:hypothetical protein